MNEVLRINNMYAAYTATSNKSDKQISELSKILKGEDAKASKEEQLSANMDTVIISKEALESLRNMSLVAEQKAENPTTL